MPHSRRHHHPLARHISDEMEDWLNNPFSEGQKEHAKMMQRDVQGGGGQPPAIHTVYKTLKPTFEGPVAGYSTLNSDSAADPTQDLNPILLASNTGTPEPQSTANPRNKANPSVVPSMIRQPTTTVSEDNGVLAKATGQPTLSQSVDVGGQLFASTPTLKSVSTTTLTSESTTSKPGNGGSSAGIKAGIAFGVLGGVFIIGLVAFFLFTRRRRKAVATAPEELDDEKYRRSDSSFENMPTPSDPHAPRISLRPVTQFLPNLSIDRRTSKGAGAALTQAAATDVNSQNSVMRDRPVTSQSTCAANPFGSQAERVPEPPIQEHVFVPSSDSLTANGPVVAASAAAADDDALITRKDKPKKLDLTIPAALDPDHPTSAGTQYSTASFSPGSALPRTNGAAAIAAAGGPPNSNVHRVQLDFKPSLDDEMEMKAGELIRLLHEYDDGWALCIRLDRSQQGVVPRTCLSTRPVKPRTSHGGPRPGPPINPSGQFPQGPGQRPSTLQQGHSPVRPGVSDSAGPRQMSLSGQPQSSGPRYSGHPLSSPTSQPRSRLEADGQTVGPAGVVPSMQAPSPPRVPPNGPPTGPVGRKPVPGQAY